MQTECAPGMKSPKRESNETTVKRSFKLRGANARSKVTNGVKLLPGFDGRTVWGRRFHDLCALHARDMGGVDTLSEAQISLIRRAAALEVTLENLELDMACGRDVDLDQYSRCAGHLRRILESVGIKLVAKDVTPSLADIVAQHQREAAERAAQPQKASEAPTINDEAAKGVQPAFPARDDVLADREAAE